MSTIAKKLKNNRINPKNLTLNTYPHSPMLINVYKNCFKIFIVYNVDKRSIDKKLYTSYTHTRLSSNILKTIYLYIISQIYPHIHYPYYYYFLYI